MPVKQSEAAMSPEQRRREVAALLGLAVRRLAKRPGAGVARPPQHAGESEAVNTIEHADARRHRPDRPHGLSLSATVRKLQAVIVRGRGGLGDEARR